MLPRKYDNATDGHTLLTIMFKDQGQGGGMSIEDAGALGVLFSSIDSKASIPARLQLFQSLRYSRASAIQIFSNFGQDEATKMAAEAAKYCSGKVPSKLSGKRWVFNTDIATATQMEFHQFLFSYNVLEDAQNRVNEASFSAD